MVSELLCEFQHSFRAGRSCEAAVALFTQYLYDAIDKTSGKAIVVFVDFTKAFDSLNHVIFLEKLMNNFDSKIEPYMVKLFQNYFTDRKFKIQNGSYQSKEYDIKSGTPAGSALGPISYSLFINDIAEGLTLPFQLFADDLAFYVECTDINKGLEKVNECYEKLKEWCSKNCLKLNESKTKLMVFHKPNDYRSKNLLPNYVKLGTDKIEVVSTFKYLGVHLDSTLSFSKHYETVENKMNVALSKLYGLRRFFTEENIKIFLCNCFISLWLVSHEKTSRGLLVGKPRREKKE